MIQIVDVIWSSICFMMKYPKYKKNNSNSDNEEDLNFTQHYF